MKKFLFAGLALLLLCVLMLGVWVAAVLSHLPDVSTLKHYRPAAAAEVLDKDGRIITEYFDRKFRIWVPISSLPDTVIHAVTTAEDDTFFEHKGVNYKATWDALVHDFQKRRLARGGSTITQQMIKNVFLTKEKTVTRKLREYVLARRAEEILTKRQILQIYLNEVEWGDNVYGIEAASRFYFGKHASDLTIAEAALLAGMLPNPHYYNPFKRLDKAKDRQHRVLANMVQARLISEDEYQTALQSDLELRKQEGDGLPAAAGLAKNRPCYLQALEQILADLFGDQKLYRGGLTIRTTLDKSMEEELSGLDGTSAEPGTIEEVTVVMQADSIRALLCTTGRDDEIREKINTPVFALTGYTVSRLSIDSITREQILQMPQNENPAGR
jgi:penicillin-binding protein 1A